MTEPTPDPRTDWHERRWTISQLCGGEGQMLDLCINKKDVFRSFWNLLGIRPKPAEIVTWSEFDGTLVMRWRGEK